MPEDSISKAVDEAVAYITDAFEEDAVEVERSLSHDGKITVYLHAPGGFLDPVNTEQLHDLGFKLVGAYTSEESWRSTTLDWEHEAAAEEGESNAE